MGAAQDPQHNLSSAWVAVGVPLFLAFGGFSIVLGGAFWQINSIAANVGSIRENFVSKEGLQLTNANIQRQLDALTNADDKVAEAGRSALEKVMDAKIADLQRQIDQLRAERERNKP